MATSTLPDLDEWTADARQWLGANAERRPSAASETEQAWGEGDFSVAVFHNKTDAEQQTMLDEACECLVQAAGLDGCQNRVQILDARARIERARRKALPEAKPELERIVAMCEQHLDQEPSSSTWSGVLDEARAELANAHSRSD